MSDAPTVNLLHAGAVPIEPPAAPIVAPGASPSDVVTDAKGRIIKLRSELTFLQEMDLDALLGARASNDVFRTKVFLCARVSEIDAVPVPFPTNEAQMRAMLSRVDRAGMIAVIEHLVPADPEADEVAAKN